METRLEPEARELHPEVFPFLQFLERDDGGNVRLGAERDDGRECRLHPVLPRKLLSEARANSFTSCMVGTRAKDPPHLGGCSAASLIATANVRVARQPRTDALADQRIVPRIVFGPWTQCPCELVAGGWRRLIGGRAGGERETAVTKTLWELDNRNLRVAVSPNISRRVRRLDIEPVRCGRTEPH